MNKPNRIFDDLAGLASGALSLASTVQEQIRTEVKRAVHRIVRELDLVPRSDFEALEEMVRKLRDEQEAMKAKAKPKIKVKKKTPAKKKPATKTKKTKKA